MTDDRDKLFLKLALSNEFLTADQVEAVLAARAERKELGIERTAAEIAIEREFLTEEQAESLARTVRDLRPPEKIGGFEIIDEIGKGAVGTVYRARQVSLDKIVALKVMHQKHSSNATFIQQFEREAKAAGKINHPHVVQAIDAGHADGFYYLAMELVEGESLKARVKSSGSYSEQDALDLGRSIAQGLANAHGHGLLHRDLKPDNILLGTRGEIKIADFGLAMPLDDADLMSVEHQRMGTPFYLSPEQAQGKGLSEASEIYSLGATLYFAVTGKPPFTGSSLKEILTKQVHQEPVPPTQLGANVGELTESLIMDCLVKDPTERVASAQAFVDRVTAIERTVVLNQGPPRPAPRSRKPKVRGAVPTPPTPPAAPAKPKVKKRATATAPARPTPARPGRSEPIGAAEPASRTYAKRNRNVFTMAGIGLGILLAFVFLLLAIKKNSSEVKENEKVEQAEVSEEIREGKIKARLATWRNEIDETAEKIRKQLTTIETAAKTDRLRLEALFTQLEVHPFSPAAPEVVARIDAIRAQAKGDLRSGADRYFAEAERLEREGRWFDALMALEKIPQRLVREKEIGEEVRTKIDELSDRIDTEFVSDNAAIKAALAKKDYAAAIEILERVVKYGDEDKARDAETRLVQLKKDKASLAASEATQRRQEETKKYAAIIGEYKSLCDQRRFTECISKAITLQAEITTPTVNQQLETDLTAFQMLDGFVNDALSWYADQEAAGTEITLEKKDEEKIVGTSAGFEREGEKVTLKIQVKRGGGVATRFIPLDDISDATIFGFVEEKHSSSSAAYIVPLGVLFTYRQRLDIAERHFELAKQNGITPTQWLEKLEFIRKQG